MYSSEFRGIQFIEGLPEGVRILRHLDVRIDGVFSQAQLKSIDDVKLILVEQVRAEGGNALVNFKYGQRSSLWSTLVGIDNVGWYGSGDAAVLGTSK
jgi:hypothetical protein